MAAISRTHLGQLLPAIDSHGFKAEVNKQISSLSEVRKIQAWVASDNAFKVQAAKNSLLLWAEKYSPSATVDAKGVATSSDISEQPHSKEETELGAKNRLTHLKEYVKHTAISFDALQVFVSMENGIMQESVPNLKNQAIFIDTEGKCWIDRCCVVVEVASSTLQLSATALSEGVTAPVSTVKDSEKTNWTKTCGFFIQKEYDFPAKDWHGKMAGKSREAIIQETIQKALGVE
jgi:non-canonical (house-cleaning) NTP pyrophosphatase